MPRLFLVVLDSVGCGGALDAAQFGDAGADTLGHIARACADRRADRPGLRAGPLRLPHLDALGLGVACQLSTGHVPPGLSANPPRAIATCAREQSSGKDTPSGHWEMAGGPHKRALHLFPDTHPAFPPDLVAAIIREGHLPGILGDCHGEGIGVIDTFGEAHLETGAPILYTSADSVLQIAAHEERFGLARLYDLCAIVRKLVDPLDVGRVIARPFTGTSRATFRRTANRTDFPIPAPHGNLLDRAAEAGRDVVTLGKVGDIFGHRATGREIKGRDNDALIISLVETIAHLGDGGLAFANLVDFDTEFGHRRDVAGYAAALERFDAHVPALLAALKPGDLLIVTADHGNDPTMPGASHTRENVPVLCFGPELAGRIVPMRETFADIGQTGAAHLKLRPVATGTNFL